jgi:NADH:ubiquinone oxidoreductase subunit 2 (subunit N)
MIAEKNLPFLAGFVLNTYFLGVFLFGTRFITQAGWFVQGINIQGPLQTAGAIMLGVGGILAIFTKNLSRLMGAVMITEIGKSLLAISLFLAGFPLYFGMVIIQSLALGVWVRSLSHLGQVLRDFEYESAVGAARQWPGITSGFLVGYFTLAGLPFLAGFPLYWALGFGLNLYPFWINIWYVLGTVGLLIGGIRAVGALTLDSGEETVLQLGTPYQRYLIFVLNGILLSIGLFPQGLLNLTQTITELILGG